MSSLKPVTEVVSTLGEGAIWYKDTFIWVDILGKKVHRYKPADDSVDSTDLDENVGTIVPRKSGGYVVALQHGFAFLNEDDTVSPAGPVVDDRPEIRFNDGKCDPRGRLWAGTMEYDGAHEMGTLYMLDTDLTVSEKIPGVSTSNGICWSADEKTMYYIDTPTQKVVAYDFDADTGNISNPRVVVEIDPKDGHPDGMTIDSNGNLWIALWAGYAVVCHDPNTGERLDKIDVPANQVTACAFGGKDLKELYITTARVGYDEARLEKEPLAGRVFRVQTEVSGVPAIPFEG